MAELDRQAVRPVRHRGARLRRGVGRARHQLGHRRARRAGARRSCKQVAGLPASCTRSCGRASTTTACSPRRSRAGRWCSATTSTARSARSRRNAIPEPVLPKGTFAGRNIAFTSWTGYTGNLPDLPQQRRRRRPLQPAGRRRRRVAPRADDRSSSTARTTSRCRSPWCARCIALRTRAGCPTSSRATRRSASSSARLRRPGMAARSGR